MAPALTRHRTALVGIGYWGPNLLRNLVMNGGFDVVGVADKRIEMHEKVTRVYPHIPTFSSLEEMLEKAKPEAVVIATPPITHRDIAITCMKSGAHVLIEKPMALSPNECDDIMAVAKQTKKKVMVDHTFVFHPAIQHLSDAIDKKELGKLLYYDSVRVNLGGYQRAADVLWDLAPHDLSILDYLLRGEQPSVVTVMGASHYDRTHANLCYVHLAYESGFVAHLHLNWTAPMKVRTIMLGGSEKMAVYDENLSSEKVRIYDRGLTVDDIRVSYRAGDMIAPAISSQEALSKVLTAFYDCLTHGKQPVSDAPFAKRVVEVLDAAAQSMKSGGVPIPVRSKLVAAA